MRKLLILTLSCFALGAGGWGIWTTHSLQERNYRLTHVLLRCDGRTLLYYGNHTEAVDFLASHCRDWGVVPNQDYDPTA